MNLSDTSVRKRVTTALDGTVKNLFAEAVRGLHDPAQTDDGRVHATRKYLKRLRALSKLMDALEAVRLSDADRFALRTVAHSLGRVRTPVAEAEAWLEFSASVGSDSAATGRRLLEARRAPEVVIRRGLQRSEKVLAGLGKRVIVGTSKLTQAEEYDHEAFLSSLRRAYRKGRRAMQRAQASPSWERLHELRRASKDHRYQLQFLELFFEDRIKPERLKLARLTDKLGNHHDLGGSARYLRAQSAFLHQPLARKTLKKLRRRLRVIETRCLDVASVSFQERPKAFEARIRQYLDSLGFGG